MRSPDLETARAQLRRRARRAYERGRLRLACGRCLPVLLVVAVAAGIAAAETRALVVAAGLGLWVLCLAAHALGRGLQEGVGPGLVAGAVTGGAAFVAYQANGCCASSLPACAVACGTGGVLVGAWLAARLILRRPAESRRDAAATAVAAMVASMTAALVCLPIGAGVLLGALGGLALGLAPAVVLRPAA